MPNEKEVNKAKELQEKLFMKKKNSGLIMSETELEAADKFCDGYKRFLDDGKTEREAVKAAIALAEKAGFSEFDSGKKYGAGDKVYLNNRGKALILSIIGKEDSV